MTSHSSPTSGASPTAYATRHPRTPDHAPSWFSSAMAAPVEPGCVVVEGVEIRYLSWGPVGTPAVLLVHGGAAHAMWWGPLAARLAPGRRVVAMDLSGHGTSGRRGDYTVDLWAREVVEVALAVSAGPATVVGHSLGGIILSHVGLRYGELLERAIMVDAPTWRGAPGPDGELSKVAGRPLRRYPSLAEAIPRFRLVPSQDSALGWYVEHIAFHGLTPDGEGWRWRFDPRIFAGSADGREIVRFEGDLADCRCPWALVMGGDSYLRAGSQAVFGAHPTAPWRVVPDAGHHVMLDQPEALQETLRDLLDGWD